MAEDILKNPAGIGAVLSNTVGGVGIGAYGNDLTAQFPEPAEYIRCYLLNKAWFAAWCVAHSA